MYTRVSGCMIAALEQFFSFTFHDAQLYSIRVDYAARTITMDVACLQREYDAAGELLLEEYRRGNLVLQGMEYACLDLNEAGEMEVFESPEIISEFLAEEPDYAPDNGPRQPLPDGVTAYRVYLFSWNRFIHLAVREASFSWMEAPRYTSWHVLEVISRLRMRIADHTRAGLGCGSPWLG